MEPEFHPANYVEKTHPSRGTLEELNRLKKSYFESLNEENSTGDSVKENYQKLREFLKK